MAQSLLKIAAYCILLFSLSVYPFSPVPVQGGRLSWTAVDTPGTAFNVISSPSEINDLAVTANGRTIYVVDTASSRVYRSDDGGAGWNSLTASLTSAGATLPAWQIAVAPDNPHILAIVTSSSGLPRAIFISVDGGQSWSNSNFSDSGNISSLSISPFYGSYDIAAGTRSGGSGELFVYKATGIGGSWAAQGLNGDVLAVRFSPSYRSDASIAVLYSNATGTYFNTGIRDLVANTTNWSAIYTGVPAEITVGGAGSSARANQVIRGDLELPSDFSGQSPSFSRAYISLDTSGGSAGIFRVDNKMVFQLMTGQPNRRFSSISFFGTYLGGKLLAGEVTGNPAQAVVLIWYTDAPGVCPATCWYQSTKSPTGAGTSGYGNAQVVWSPDGSRAYCGTSSAVLNNPSAWPSALTSGTALDESALSCSIDNGHNWDQLSLIDTQINFLSDVAVTIDSATIYLASINTGGAGFDSIWKSSAQTSSRSWKRVLCYPSPSNDIILRTNNYSNDQSIFAASRNTDDLRQSLDGGLTWKTQIPGMQVADFSVTSINNIRYIFIINSGGMARRGNASTTITQWSQQVATNLSGAHCIFAAPNGLIVAGGSAADNRVAFSGDAGSTFITTPPLQVPGAVHAIVDYRISNAFIIYAATDNPASNIYFLVSLSGTWNAMGAPATGYYGLAQWSTFYGITGSSISRTLAPEQLMPPAIEWNLLIAGLPEGVAFTREPVGLKLSSGINLWAIDSRPYNLTANTGRLWNFSDTLAPGLQYSTPPVSSSPSSSSSTGTAGPSVPVMPPREILFSAPVPYAPAPDDLIPIYINDNSVGEITFKWKSKTPAPGYELWLASDPDFSSIIFKKTIRVDNRHNPAWTLNDRTGITPGHTYYWKIRIVQAANGETGKGEWSEVYPFTVAKNTSKIPSTSVESANQTSSMISSASEIKNQAPAFKIADIFNELPLWQTVTVLFLVLAVCITLILLIRGQRRI